MPPQALLSIKDVSKAFPGVKALDRVSLEVSGGVVHGIVGENGAGKSTLMKILSGVYEKDSGEIVFEGQVIDKITPVESMKMGLSIIYQELNLVNTMTVGENIFLGRFSESGGRAGVHTKARALLDSIGSKVNTHRQVSELSVSDKQMVEIAKALSFDSKLIIMDEPSSSLTADEMQKLIQIIHDLKSKGIAIIYISHKLDEIFGFCDVVTVMRDGHVIDTRRRQRHLPQRDDLDDGGQDHRERVPAPAGQRRRDDPRDQGHEHQEVARRQAHPAGRARSSAWWAWWARGARSWCEPCSEPTRSRGRPSSSTASPSRSTARSMPSTSGLAMVPEDRKLQGLLLGFSVEQNISLAVLARLTKHGFIDCQGRGRRQRSTDQGAQHQDAIRKDQDPDAVGR